MRTAIRLTALLSLMLPWPLTAAAAAEPAGRQLHELVDAAAELLRSRARNAYPNGNVEVAMQPLDPRLTLAACEEAELTPRGQQQHGRIPVAVRCLGPTPWSVFVMGDVTVAVPMVVTRRPVRRGEVLSASMVTTERRQLAGSSDLFHSDPADVVGKEARRNLQRAAPVSVAHLAEPLAVTRGSTVQLVARRGTVQITSVGEALGAGKIGAEIRVRNLNSGRIVRGRIEGPGRVLTTPAR